MVWIICEENSSPLFVFFFDAHGVGVVLDVE